MFATERISAQPVPYQSDAFQERLDAAALALGRSPRFKDRSQQYRQKLAEFVSGNIRFVLCHEVAHAAMTQMRLPVLGRTEDAADSFATLRLIRMARLSRPSAGGSDEGLVLVRAARSKDGRQSRLLRRARPGPAARIPDRVLDGWLR